MPEENGELIQAPPSEDIFAEAREKADRFFVHDEQWFVEDPHSGQAVPVYPGMELLAFHYARLEWTRAVVNDYTSTTIRVQFPSDTTRFVFGDRPALRLLRGGVEAPARPTADPSPSVHGEGHSLPLPVVEAQVIASILTELSALPPPSRQRIIEAVSASLNAM